MRIREGELRHMKQIQKRAWLAVLPPILLGFLKDLLSPTNVCFRGTGARSPRVDS